MPNDFCSIEKYDAPVVDLHIKKKTPDFIRIRNHQRLTENSGKHRVGYAGINGGYNLFIAIPNGLGTLFGVVQIFLCIIFPREHQHNAAIETDLVVFPVAVNQSHPNVDVER